MKCSVMRKTQEWRFYKALIAWSMSFFIKLAIFLSTLSTWSLFWRIMLPYLFPSSVSLMRSRSLSLNCYNGVVQYPLVGIVHDLPLLQVFPLNLYSEWWHAAPTISAMSGNPSFSELSTGCIVSLLCYRDLVLVISCRSAAGPLHVPVTKNPLFNCQ